MKAFFLLLLCVMFSLTISAQTDPPAAAGDGSGIEDVYLAKDDGSGKAGDVVTSFGVSDIPIHCIVQLDTVRIATIKMNLVAVSVPGVKPETKVVTTVYTTKENQNQVNFTGKPDKVWTPGKYRVDIFLNGKLAKSQDFTIEKPAGEKAPVTNNSAVTSFQPKQAEKPKPTRKPRKN